MDIKGVPEMRLDTGCLALVGMYCIDICLGYEIFFGSPDVGPDTLASQVGQR